MSNFTSTNYIYPASGQIVWVNTGHTFPVLREYIGIDPQGKHVFQDQETQRILHGHCSWRPQEPKVPSLKEQGWNDCADKLPKAKDEVWVHSPSGDVVRCEFSREHPYTYRWFPVDPTGGFFFGALLWRKVEYVPQLLAVETPPAAPVFPSPATEYISGCGPDVNVKTGWHEDGNRRPGDGQWVWIQRGTGAPVICKYSGTRYLFECVEGSELGRIYPGNRPWHLLTPPSL